MRARSDLSNSGNPASLASAPRGFLKGQGRKGREHRPGDLCSAKGSWEEGLATSSHFHEG